MKGIKVVRGRKALLSHMRSIEERVYPLEYRLISKCNTWADLCDYCEGKPHVFTWGTGYCIYTKYEIVDLASTEAVPLKVLAQILKALKNFYGNRLVEISARESTSYKLIRFLQRRGHLDYRILGEDEYDDSGELIFDIEFQFK